MCFGGSSSSTSTSASSNSTTVNVTPTTNINTADLADAIKALAGSQSAGAVLNAAGQVQAAQYRALGDVVAAQAAAGPSSSTIIFILIAAIGVAFTAGVIKLPRSLRA